MTTYVTTFERFAKEEGLLEGQKRFFLLLLTDKFGAVPTWAMEKISNATEEALETWGIALGKCDRLEDIFAS